MNDLVKVYVEEQENVKGQLILSRRKAKLMDAWDNIQKALDKDGARLFQDGDKASLRREISASILEEIQLAMVNAGADKEVKEAKADLKS